MICIHTKLSKSNCARLWYIFFSLGLKYEMNVFGFFFWQNLIFMLNQSCVQKEQPIAQVWQRSRFYLWAANLIQEPLIFSLRAAQRINIQVHNRVQMLFAVICQEKLSHFTQAEDWLGIWCTPWQGGMGKIISLQHTYIRNCKPTMIKARVYVSIRKAFSIIKA